MVKLNRNTIGLITGGFVLLAGGCIAMHESMKRKKVQFTIVDKELLVNEVKLTLKIVNTGRKDIKNLTYHVVIKNTRSPKFSIGPISNGHNYDSIIQFETPAGYDFDSKIRFVIDKMN
jgi:hypothetical protein